MLVGHERKEFAQRVLDATHNDFGGSESAEALAEGRFIVVVEREDDSWALSAHNDQEIAGIVLGTYTGTEGYDEWVDVVYDLDNHGQPYEYEVKVSVTVNEATVTV